ncbi:MAG: PAS domain S-box protein, partial [Spirochaetia bacterium]|nr:PAS domain S-box protein [Spirochaetia bacterium]
MAQPLRMLLLEDNAADAELILRTLKQSGFEVTYDRVDNEKDFLAHLHPGLDLILSDYQLPSFIGLQALELVKSRGLRVPFILISGTVGEDIAVMAMRNGASDYLMKDRLTRLGEAIRRSLEERRLREEHEIAERALKGSEDKFAALIDSAMNGIISFDSKQTVTLWNPAAQAMFGYTKEEILGQPLSLLIPERFRNQHPIKSAGRTQTDVVFRVGAADFLGKHKDGWEFPIEIYISEMVVDGEKSFTIVVNNITERKEADAQVRKTAERFRQVVENIGEVFWMTDIEKNTIIYISPGYEKVWGRPAAVLYDSPRAWIEAIHNEDQARVLDAMTRQQTGEYDIEYRITRPDGGLRWIHDRAFPVANEAGQVYRIAGVAEDITRRKEFEIQLHQRDRQLLESQAVAGIGSWELDVSSGAVLWSEQQFKMLGLVPFALTPSFDLYLGFLEAEDQTRLKEAVERCVSAGELFSLDHRIVRSDGLMRWFQTRGEPVVDLSGKVERIRGTTQDITDRFHLESQLQQAQKMEAIGRLSGGVAHDFNNLLTVILGHIAVLETCNLEPDAAESTEAIKLAAQRAANLTRQLLLFARKQTMQIHRIDLNETIAQTGKMLARVLGEDIDQEIVLSESSFIDADPGMLDQILLNLAVNARDAMPGGGKLRITTTNVEFDAETAANSSQIKAGRFACISVQDTGIGIKPDVIPKIFDPFFTTKSVGKGTGLGLSTVFA